MSANSEDGLNIGVVAGVIGVIITMVLYWANLAAFHRPLITESGAWITVVVSVFLTGWIPIALNSEGGMGWGMWAGFIGASFTLVLFWVNLAIFGQAVITESGVWLTVVLSAFLTGWTPFAIGS